MMHWVEYKMFSFNAILAYARGGGKYCAASSGIAATVLKIDVLL